MSRSFPFGRTIIRAVERSTSGSACQELKLTRMKVWLSCLWQQKRWLAGEGEGKGGGTGGTIRSAGGPFGKKQATEEERYFKEEQRRQIQEMKTSMRASLSEKLKELERQLAAYKERIASFDEAIQRGENTVMYKMRKAENEEAAKAVEEGIKQVNEMWKKMNL